MSDVRTADNEPAGVVVWITGRPSAGKSRFARNARKELTERGRSVCVLDGDEVRAALVPTPGYDRAARDAFYETLARIAALLARQGLVTLVAATAHRVRYREAALRLAPRYIEVFVDVPSAELERRDSKGLYQAVREGRISNVPGADLAYETPSQPDVRATGGDDPDALARVLAAIG